MGPFGGLGKDAAKRLALRALIFAVVFFMVFAFVNNWLPGPWGPVLGLFASAAVSQVVAWLIPVGRGREVEPKQVAVEQNYLRRLEDELNRDAKAQPLVPTDDQIVRLAGTISDPPEIVSPRYRVFSAVDSGGASDDQGKLTTNLVRFLLKSDVPVVILGDPGSGKSLSLQQVARVLIKHGLKSEAPLLPIYLRLGAFTEPLPHDGSRSGQDLALKFAQRSLSSLGPAAKQLADNLAGYLIEGRVVFLLDAMDEMRRDDYAERFETLSQLRHWSPNKLLFACRKLDFRQTFPFRRCEIQPFDTRQVRSLLGKVLSSEGRVVARQVLAPANDLRDLASNPFFLRLLAHFYKTQQKLPQSRAELMRVHEEMLLARAEQRRDFPPILASFGDVAFRAVLARLAYLITSSRRGVTIPTKTFLSQFLPSNPSSSERPLLGYGNEVARAVLGVAKSEHILRVGNEYRDNAEDGIETVSFYHHRLQEYYSAVYLDVYRPEVSWRDHWDDIWWQETLIMLVGVTRNPGEPLQQLLATLPGTVLVCPVIGGALADIAKSRAATNPSDMPDAIRKLSVLDETNLYGLKNFDQNLADFNEGRILRHLVAMGLLRDESVGLDVLEKLDVLVAEPDADPDREAVRRWLEQRNGVVLDRVELAAECARNTRREIGAKVTARVTPLLSELSRDGNTVEAVRAVQIAAKLVGTGPFEVAQWSMLRGSAWGRREALAAIATQPLESGASWSGTSAVVFLQSIKGELLFALPQLLRSVGYTWHLILLLPLVAVALTVSAAAALSPLVIYWILLHRYPSGLFGLDGALGRQWSWWALSIAILVGAWAYLTRAAWGVAILRTMVFMIALLLAAPWAFDVYSGADLGTYLNASGREGGAAIFATNGRLVLLLLTLLAVAYAPQAVLAIALLGAAGLWSLFTVSPVVLGGAWTFVRKGEMFRGQSDYLSAMRDRVSAFALIAAVALGLGFIIGVFTWLDDIYYMLVGLALIIWLGGLALKWRRGRREEAKEGLIGGLLIGALFIGFSIIVAVIAWTGIIGAIGRFLGGIWGSGFGSALLRVLVALLCLGLVLVLGKVFWLLMRSYADAFVYLTGRYLPGRWSRRYRDAYLLRAALTRYRDGRRVSADEQYEAVRTVMGQVRSRWARSMAEQRLYRLRKEARQEILGERPDTEEHDPTGDGLGTAEQSDQSGMED